MPVTLNVRATRASAPDAPPVPPFVPDYYVSPSGSAGNNGSIGSPWSLQHALSGASGVIQPGDSIALRGGTYSGTVAVSTVSGTQANPIVFRQYPAERAILSSTDARGLRVEGSDTWFWGFEITAPTAAASAYGILNYSGSRSKFINLTIHDAVGGSGFTNFASNGARHGELYGCLIYNNGDDNNLDHGAYINTNATGDSLSLAENVIFNNWAFGIHGYNTITNITMRGNATFNNNAISGTTNQADLLAWGQVVTGLTVDENFLYRSSAGTAEFGAWFVSPDGDGAITLTDNYLMGGRDVLDLSNPWNPATVTGNTFYGGGERLVNLRNTSAGHTWNTNTFYGSASDNAFRYNGGAATTLATWKTQSGLSGAGNYDGTTPPDVVFVRPNAYEAGRGHIIAYNWSGASSVSADLSGVLSNGQAYDILNVQDFFGTPVVSGTYGGGNVSIPMAGIAGPTPVTRTGLQTPPVTGPTFQVFVVRLQGA